VVDTVVTVSFVTPKGSCDLGRFYKMKRQNLENNFLIDFCFTCEPFCKVRSLNVSILTREKIDVSIVVGDWIGVIGFSTVAYNRSSGLGNV